MDKLKLSQLGERLKTGGAQMGRIVSGKMKEILQTPTPESKMVDEATLETLEGPNWGMNLRICAMINSEEFSGSEIVRAIKKKILSKNAVSQRLSLDLLEACTTNCEKVFSEVASEKLLEDMVRMIENPQTDYGNKEMALQLIRAWGESEELEYLPAFRQTYMSLKGRAASAPIQDGTVPPMQYSLESYVHQLPMSPPEEYPVLEAGPNGADHTLPYAYGHLSVEEIKEFLVTTRNSLELLSSILDTETEPKPIKDDLTVTMLENCKQSQVGIKRVIETTTDDDVMLFEALNLHDELQQVISRYEELEAALKSQGQPSEHSSIPETGSPAQVGIPNETHIAASSITETSTPAQVEKTPLIHTSTPAHAGISIETATSSPKKESTESITDKKNVE